jgi:DNA-binding NtrC family response regulator
MPRIEREVFRSFEKYPWHGNIRELENVIERMVVLSNNESLTLEDVPENVRDFQTGSRRTLVFFAGRSD